MIDRRCVRTLTVASNNNEFILVRQLVLRDVGVGGDDLRFRRQVGVFLVLEIAESAGQREIAYDKLVKVAAVIRCSQPTVHAPVFNVSACGRNACLLG
jgi:hypothetical protein